MKRAASLPWYNFASTRPTLDRVWREVRAQLTGDGYSDLPQQLDHKRTFRELAAGGNFLLSQCCGLDLLQPYSDEIVPVGAPVITTLDASNGYYYSYIVTRTGADFTDLLEPLRVVINDPASHSGSTAIKVWLATNHGGACAFETTGSHARSVHALQSAKADVAAIDAFSWQFLDTHGLQVLARSAAAPAPPFVTGKHSDIPGERLLTALDVAFTRHGNAMGISAVVPVELCTYRDMFDQARRYNR